MRMIVDTVAALSKPTMGFARHCFQPMITPGK